ncbi:hypothetical protein AWB95_09370 [Mycobacterium celatum]|uniref:Uncharacterized protein n=1 Tax=Mycobacterium celatum TaxID=28045 RepID=A0A1X1RSL7_MYCCE|nr:hypothetical protein AWB95_09370 [Mycobacterium celatum]
MIWARLLAYSSSVTAPDWCSRSNSCKRSPIDGSGAVSNGPAAGATAAAGWAAWLAAWRTTA